MKLPVVSTDIQMRFSDTDALGHITSACYLNYLELGRTDFFIELSKHSPVINNAVVNANIDYLSEVIYGEAVRVKTWCSRMGNKSMTLSAEVYANDRLAAKGETTMVGFDVETRTSCAFPNDWEASS